MYGTAIALRIFFFNETATTDIYTLSLHDALPIYLARVSGRVAARSARRPRSRRSGQRLARRTDSSRSEEHTSELQSRRDLVCRLLLEKKKRPLGYSPKVLNAGHIHRLTPVRLTSL